MRQLSVLRCARLLRRHVEARLNRRESGAVATIVAVLLGGGVVLGCAALTIDTGSLMWERRQLQNGADAASLAAAKACATVTPCNPPIGSGSVLANLADANAVDSDGISAIESICGSSTTVAANHALSLCPTAGSTPPLIQCPAVPPALAAGNYVEVRTRTLTASPTPTILPPQFAQTLTGYTGNTVRTCARAAWGPPASMGISVPITLSDCEWKNATLGTPPASTPTYATEPVGAWPGYGGAGQPAWPAAASTPPVPGQELVIMLQDPSHPQTCTNWNGHDVAGGFGYLDASSCSPTLSATNWNKIDPGSGWTSLGCDLAPYWQKIIYLPVFDCVAHQNPMPGPVPPWPANCYDTNGGGNHWYHIEGFAKFYLSGYKLGGGPAVTRASHPLGGPPCTGAQRCLSGWFLQGLVPATSISPTPLPGPPLGGYAVQVAG